MVMDKNLLDGNRTLNDWTFWRLIRFDQLSKQNYFLQQRKTRGLVPDLRPGDFYTVYRKITGEYLVNFLR